VEPRGARRTLWTGRTRGPRWALRARRAGDALRALRPLRSRRAVAREGRVEPRDELRSSVRAVRTRRLARSDDRRTGRALRARRTLRTGGACCTGRPRGALRPCRAGDALHALRPLHTRRSVARVRRVRARDELGAAVRAVRSG